MSRATRKAINFDFSKSKLEENLNNLQTKGTYTKAYYDIRKYLENLGFEHQQESAYTSPKPISHKKVLEIVSDLTQQFPYMKEAFKSVEITSVSFVYDVTDLVRENHNLELVQDENLYKLESDYGIKLKNNQPSKKSVRFDFSQESLEESFNKYGIISNITDAYTVIKNHFIGLGYTHEQGSVYLFPEKTTDSKVLKDILIFSENCPYLAEGFSSVQISNAQRKYDITSLANGTEDMTLKEDENERIYSQMSFRIEKDNQFSI